MSAYDKEFFVAKLNLISASVNSLQLNSNDSAHLLHNLMQAHNPSAQITPKIESTSKAINLNSTHGTRVH